MSITMATIVPLHRTSTAASVAAPVLAGIYSMTAGVLEIPASLRHRLMLHIGRPVWTACVSDRLVDRQLRHEGDIALLPAGSEARFERESPSTVLIVELAPALVQEAALDMGFDRRSLIVEHDRQLREPGGAGRRVHAPEPHGPACSTAFGRSALRSARPQQLSVGVFFTGRSCCHRPIVRDCRDASP